MPLPVSSVIAADAYARLRGQAAQMSVLAQQFRDQVAAGTVYSEFALQVLGTAIETQAVAQACMAVPGLLSYASMAIGATTVTLAGTLSAGSATVASLSSTAGLLLGMGVAGVGIPADAKIVGMGGGTPASATLTLSQAATADGTGVTLTCTLDVAGLFNASLGTLEGLRAALLADYPHDATTMTLQDRTFDAQGNVQPARFAASQFAASDTAAQAFLTTLN